MDHQLALDLGPRSGREAVCFFALRPDAGAARAMLDVANRCLRGHGLTARPYGADRLHLSLAAVESWRGLRKGDVAAAMRAAAGLRAPSFSVTFDRVCTFRGRNARPLVLSCGGCADGLAALREALRDDLMKARLWPGPASFQPHVTLLWDTRRVPVTYLDEPIRWTVHEIVLVQSLIGRSRHVDLGRWRLDGQVGAR